MAAVAARPTQRRLRPRRQARDAHGAYLPLGLQPVVLPARRPLLTGAVGGPGLPLDSHNKQTSETSFKDTNKNSRVLIQHIDFHNDLSEPWRCSLVFHENPVASGLPCS